MGPKEDYIGIVEPDDYVGLNMYEELYNIAIEKDLDLIKADFYSFWYRKKLKIHYLIYTYKKVYPKNIFLSQT